MRETISKQVLSVLLDADRARPVIADHCANNLLKFITRFTAGPGHKGRTAFRRDANQSKKLPYQRLDHRPLPA
jgi:hypothetical protein